MINRLLLTLVISILSYHLFAQVDTMETNEDIELRYPSKEESRFYKKHKHHRFKPVAIHKVLQFKPEPFRIRDIDNFQPYIDSLYATPYADSIYKLNLAIDLDSLPVARPTEHIGKIDKTDVIKYEKKGDVEAMIYERWNGFGWLSASEIWIGYSKDAGKNWHYYYTGMANESPVYLKWYSSVPLIKDAHTLQVEGSLFRLTDPGAHPFPPPHYELVKDGIVIEFDLDVLTKDSDGDGLTDLEERRLFTNSFDKDSDKDGIPDNLDLNPLFHLPRTERTVVYEYLIDGGRVWDTIIPFTAQHSANKYFNPDSTLTQWIVTDNPDLLSVQPENTRVIFIRSKEYKKKSKQLSFPKFSRTRYSAFFKVDNVADTYKLDIDFDFSGDSYIVVKTRKGWRLKVISRYIS